MPKAAPSLPFQPSGVITLTTDFGHKDPFVGVMKGQVLRRFPAARLVDLTHEILVHWPAEAGFWLGRSFGYFPPGTVHVAVVDPGVGSSRDIAVVEAEGQLFLAPDNGLLAGVLERLEAAPILRRLDDGVLRDLGIHRPSATFHGRDIFAPVAAELAAGRLRPEALGPVVPELVPGWLDEPVLAGGQLSGAVVTVDHFGNLLTNLDAAARGAGGDAGRPGGGAGDPAPADLFRRPARRVRRADQFVRGAGGGQGRKERGRRARRVHRRRPPGACRDRLGRLTTRRRGHCTAKRIG